MHGNVWEWVQNTSQPYPAGGDGKVLGDKEEKLLAISDKDRRVLRGGSFFFKASYVRSANRLYNAPTLRNIINGFRLSRTFIP